MVFGAIAGIFSTIGTLVGAILLSRKIRKVISKARENEKRNAENKLVWT